MERYYLSGSAIIQLNLDDDPLGTGGGGSVYSIKGDNSYCVKLFHNPSQYEFEKIQYMVRFPALAKWPIDISLVWPKGLIFEDKNCTSFAGYIMHRLDRGRYRHIDSWFQLLNKRPGSSTWKNQVKIAANLAGIIAFLHRFGIVVGDINALNIYVEVASGRVFLIDCDSFQINLPNGRTCTTDVGRVEFTAPELLKNSSLKGTKRVSGHDNFALAIMIFKLLMDGFHPYAGKVQNITARLDLSENIKQLQYVYHPNSNFMPPDQAPKFYEIIPKVIREMFEKAFLTDTPSQRPAAASWRDILIEFHNTGLKKCQYNPKHYYTVSLKDRCPWCPDSVHKKNYQRNVSLNWLVIIALLLAALNFLQIWSDQPKKSEKITLHKGIQSSVVLKPDIVIESDPDIGLCLLRDYGLKDLKFDPNFRMYMNSD